MRRMRSLSLRRTPMLFTALSCALLSTVSCASIPETSDLTVIKPVESGAINSRAPAPPPNVDALRLVRGFVDAAGAPDNNYAAGRLYLGPTAQPAWPAGRELVVVDEVDTIPVAAPPGTPPNVQLVSLKADRVGRLKADQSFVSEAGEYETQLRVQQQPNGQWRIADPPSEVVTSRAAFVHNYMPVPVYFLDAERDGVVSDPRYVVARPTSALPARVVDLLMAGPSEGVRGAMQTALPPGVGVRTNVSEAEDGALVVNLSGLRDLTQNTRRLIAAQVVLSLQGVSNSRVRLQEDGAPLLPEQQELRPHDVAGYDNNNLVSGDVPGLAVVEERLRTLDRTAGPVPGPAGNGEYDVVRASLSSDGSQLAAVTRTPTGVVLRIGRYGRALSEVPVGGFNVSPPSWRGKSEVWAVSDAREVVRLVRDSQGVWLPQRIESFGFSGGQPITDLQVSRDGTRVAGVVGGKLVVAGIAEEAGQIVLQRPVVLSGHQVDSSITGLEWVSEDSLVAITNSRRTPVVEVTVDGFKWSPYASSNLVQPLTAVTVAPERRVVIADRSGVWQASGKDDLWRLLDVPIGGQSVPFYPG